VSPAVAWLLDPGPPDRRRLPPRLVAAAVFIPIGLGKFLNHDAYTERFERWGFGFAPGAVAILVGLLEVGAGLLLLLGALVRPAALALIGNMIGALATAGRIDGGQDIWLPLVMIAVLAAVLVLGAGAPRWVPPYPPASTTARDRPNAR
jgi:uncharacterized membrane protein YphA (DoxX/SURF4 family)